MEDRTLLSVRLLFDATGGTVALRGDAGDHTRAAPSPSAAMPGTTPFRKPSARAASWT
jgi:hypothetical protein